MFVVDASVAVKWFTPEENSEKAIKILELPVDLVSPSLIFIEVARAFQKKEAAGYMEFSEISASLIDLKRFLRQIYPLEDLIEDALAIAHRQTHPIFDCVYLAYAMREKCKLVTADQAFVRKMAKTPFSSHIVDLSDWVSA